MAHRHTVGVAFTSPDIEAGPRGHYHNIAGGGKTSLAQDGPKHTHTTPDGKKTSLPLPLPKSKSDEEDSKMKKTKKKTKKPKKGWY